jgi:hypothetical protein
MPPRNGTYIPTLAIRASEMNGLEFLPGLTKDRMLPVFLLAPWGSARALEKAMERIERAYPRRPFFMDFDRDYIPSNPDGPAQQEWLDLQNSEDRFDNWWNFWTEQENLLPALQFEGQDKDELVLQIRDIQEQEREFCVRIELGRMPRNLGVVIEALVEVGTADYTVIIEGGWVSDPLDMYARAHGLVDGAFEVLDGRIPIVVSCTSIPKGFHLMEGVTNNPFSNHDLLDQMRRNTNREILLYGDWGSTKPRERGFGRTPLPRIDYPLESSWQIARHKDEEWDFQDAALAIVNSPFWDGDLGVWGEQMIESTTVEPEFAIDTPQKNVAARVNIHLHRQALFGDQISGLDLDEDWID